MRRDQTTGLPERPLKLELTETLLMQNRQLATGHLAQLLPALHRTIEVSM